MGYYYFVPSAQTVTNLYRIRETFSLFSFFSLLLSFSGSVVKFCFAKLSLAQGAQRCAALGRGGQVHSLRSLQT